MIRINTIIIYFLSSVLTLSAQNNCLERITFQTDFEPYDIISHHDGYVLTGSLIDDVYSGYLGYLDCDTLFNLYHASDTSSFSSLFRVNNTTHTLLFKPLDSSTTVDLISINNKQIQIDRIDTIPYKYIFINEETIINNSILFIGEGIKHHRNDNDVTVIELNIKLRKVHSYSFPLPKHQYGTSITPLSDSTYGVSAIRYKDLNDTLPYTSYQNSLLVLDTNFSLVDVLYFPAMIWNNISFKQVSETIWFAGMEILTDSQIYDRIVFGRIDTLNDPITVTRTHITSPYKRVLPGLQSIDQINQDFYVGGTTPIDDSGANTGTRFGTIDNDYVIAKFDTNLTQQWVRFYGVPDAYDVLWKVLALEDGGCLLMGTTYDYVNATEQKRDLYIVRLDSNGNTFNTTTPPDVLADNAYRLYPNPATDQLTLRLPNSAYGHLQLLNINGQTVWQGRVEDYQTIPIAHLPPGLYLYQLTDAEQRTATGKVVVQ